MSSFDFYSVPRIIFGRGKFSQIGSLAASLGTSALIIFNGSADLADRLVDMISSAGVGWEKYRQRGEPRVEDVNAAADLARHGRCDLVIGLGGGSAIDAAKAVAGLLTNGGSALDYMEVVGNGQKITKLAAPWIAIPTTAGTGAEVTRNAVIGSTENKFKASIRGEQLLARIALVDPELSVTSPPKVTACSGMDALCQCIEAYTSTGAQPMTDSIALNGITLAARSLSTAFSDPTNLDAREDMSLAALYSGMALTNAGLGAVHGFAAPLGANFSAPHGAICAALLPHVIAANVAALRAADTGHPVLSRYCDIGRLLAANQRQSPPGFPPSSGTPGEGWRGGDTAMKYAIAINQSLAPDEAVDAAVRICANLAADLKIPPLNEFGMSEPDITPMVDLAKRASSMKYNPIVLPDDVLASVLRKAIAETPQEI